MCHAWMLVHWSGHNHCINLEYPVHIEVWRLTSGCLCICNGLITVLTTDMIPCSHWGLISGCLCIGNGFITVLSTYKPHSHLGLYCAVMAQCNIYGLITVIMSANTIQATLACIILYCCINYSTVHVCKLCSYKVLKAFWN